MIRLTALAFLVSFAVSAGYAETVQVPEKCAGRETPCVIRTSDLPYVFKAHGYDIKIVKDTILKIVKTESHLEFDVLKGRIEVADLQNAELTASVNQVLLDSKLTMVHRQRDNLEIFDSDSFVLTRYQIKQGVYPERLSSVFLSKKELVNFTSRYFSTVEHFKAYLSAIEKKWVAEFKIQNENQTKALLRAVASEEKAVEERVQKKIREENELKKVKNELFFRTFQR